MIQTYFRKRRERAITRLRKFDPHESHQMEKLAGTPLASFSSRATALVIDVVFGLLFGFVLVFLMALADHTFLHSGPPGESFTDALIRTMLDTGYADQKEAGGVVVAFNPTHSIFVAISVIIYFALITYIGNGKTPGKAFLGIRIVSLAHNRITLWQSVERALGYSVSLAEAGFGFLQYFIHPNRRTVHDRIAETVVIKELTNRDSAESTTPARGS